MKLRTVAIIKLHGENMEIFRVQGRYVTISFFPVQYVSILYVSVCHLQMFFIPEIVTTNKTPPTHGWLGI
jgi:hypothetical protein